MLIKKKLPELCFFYLNPLFGEISMYYDSKEERFCVIKSYQIMLEVGKRKYKIRSTKISKLIEVKKTTI